MTLNLGLIVFLLQILYIFADRCDLRYYQHYEHKGCKPVLEDGDSCPKRYQCEHLTDEDRLKCIHAGELYKRGELIRQPCESCTCRGDDLNGAFIECASVDCPDWEAKNKSCYMGYEADGCCPKEMCPPGKGENRKLCEYNGNIYKIGQIIRTEDVCESCVCSEQWVGPGGPGCKKVNCLTGMYAQQIRKGCLAIYSKNVCCITGIHCGDIRGGTPVKAPVEDTEGLCRYHGAFYEKGSTVYPRTSSKIECKCVVPPDFTCLRESY